MAFNQLIVKNSSTGASVALAAPYAAYKGSQITLNTVVAGTTTSSAGLVIACAGPQWNIEWGSLAALVQTQITTTALSVVSKWQGSLDGTNWFDIMGMNAPANVAVAPAGTGAPIVTTYMHAAPGINPMVAYIRLAVLSTGATGGAADLALVGYSFRKRWTT